MQHPGLIFLLIPASSASSPLLFWSQLLRRAIMCSLECPSSLCIIQPLPHLVSSREGTQIRASPASGSRHYQTIRGDHEEQIAPFNIYFKKNRRPHTSRSKPASSRVVPYVLNHTIVGGRSGCLYSEAFKWKKVFIKLGEKVYNTSTRSSDAP